jgi:FkbM family methyltransferase
VKKFQKQKMKDFTLRVIFKILKVITHGGKAMKVHFGALKGLRWIYDAGYAQYWMGTYEKEITDQFLRYVKKNYIVYDLGANIGYYTLIASKSVGKNGKVYAFEPLPPNITYLRKHVELNGLNNVHIYECAVSNETGKTLLTNCANNVANSICINSPMFQFGKSIEVAVAKLDDLILNGEINPPQLIKMDVEGAEFNALRGSQKILKAYHPTIFLSTHNCHNKGGHKKCCDFLTAMGYSLNYLNYHERKTEMDDPWYELIAEFI